MAAVDVSRDELRGLLVPDPRITYAGTYSSSLSTVTQDGMRAGVPEPQQETALVLRATDSPVVAAALRIRTVQGGFPGPDGAEFAWRYSGDTLWRGFEPPNAVSDFEFVDYSTTANKWRPYDAVTMAETSTYIVSIKDQRYVTLHRRISATIWDEVEVYDHGTTYSTDAGCCLVELPSGRVVCFYSVEGASTYVRMSYSDDDGATWTRGSSRCSPVSVPGPYRRMRAVYYQGCVVLLVHVGASSPNDEVHQWVSTDDGMHFRACHQTITVNHGYPELRVVGGRLYGAWIKETGGTPSCLPYVASVGSVGESLFAATAVAVQSTEEWATVAASSFTRGDLVLVAEETGVLWCYGTNLDAGSAKQLRAYRSADGGATWSSAAPAGSALALGDTTTSLRHICGCIRGGRVALASHHDASPGTADDSISVLWLGGYSTVTRPESTTVPQVALSEGYTSDWLPFDLPENTGSDWAASSSGAPTVSLTSKGVRVQHTGGVDTQLWTATPTTTLAVGMGAEAAIKAVVGTGYLEIRISDMAGVSYDVRVEVTPTQILLKDIHAGTTIATVTTTAGATGVVVRLDAGKATTGKCAAWYRAAGTASDRAFISIGTSTSLTAGAAATALVTVATKSGDASTDCYFYRWSRARSNRGTSAVLFAGQTNPQGLTGRTYSTAPTLVDQAQYIAADAGPTAAGDIWNVDTAYDYGIENIHPEVAPSPRVVWQATDDTPAAEIVWEMSSTLAQRSRFLSPTLGLAVFGANWRTGTLYGRDGVGTWNSIATIDAATGQTSCPFLREGDSIVVDTGGSGGAADYVMHSQLIDSYLDCGSGNVYKITAHSEGAWTTSTTKHPRFIVAGTAAAHATSGTCAIISRDHLTIAHDIGKYNAYKLVIDAQTTYEGKFRTGTIVLGSFFWFGAPYSFGRIKEHAPNTDLITDRSGTRRAKVRGPARRAVTFDWGDWVVARQAMMGSTPPNYLHAATGGAEPVATRADTLHSFASLIANHTEGPSVPVVYLERMAKSASAATIVHITNREAFMLGRVVSSSRLEHRRGSEGYSEVDTSAPYSIEEEV